MSMMKRHLEDETVNMMKRTGLTWSECWAKLTGQPLEDCLDEIDAEEIRRRRIRHHELVGTLA